MHKCSHDLSYVYFMESIRDASAAHGCKFKAYPCQNAQDWTDGKCFQCSSNSTQGGCPTVGYETSIDTRGIFYLDTLAENKTHGRYCGKSTSLDSQSIIHTLSHRIPIRSVLDFGRVCERRNFYHFAQCRSQKRYRTCIHFPKVSLRLGYLSKRSSVLLFF